MGPQDLDRPLTNPLPVNDRDTHGGPEPERSGDRMHQITHIKPLQGAVAREPAVPFFDPRPHPVGLPDPDPV